MAVRPVGHARPVRVIAVTSGKGGVGKTNVSANLALALADLSPAQHAGIIQVFSDLTINPDVLLIDTAAGLSDGVTAFTKAAHELVVVLCDEPASITDAYAIIKVMSRDHGIQRFRVLANMTRTPQQGIDLYNRMVKVTNRFLDVTLDYMGCIPYDEYLLKSVQKQRAVVDAYPRSKAAIAFKNVALKVERWPVPDVATGNLEFFVERLIRSNHLESLV